MGKFLWDLGWRAEPHLHDPALLDHAPVVLHVSLRDLAPELVLAAHNIIDDADQG